MAKNDPKKPKFREKLVQYNYINIIYILTYI